MPRRIVTTLLAAVIGATLSVGAGTAAQADGQLPIKTGPGGAHTSIVGGTEVPDGKYPFQAALLSEGRSTVDDRHRQFCGGSLISPTHVLTAAHCIDYFLSLFPLSDLRILVGRTVLTSSAGYRVQATAIDVHPQWDPHTFAFDVAVVTLATPIYDIKPIRVVSPGDTAFERPGRQTTVTGWGNTIAQPPSGGAGVSLPDRLHEVDVPMADRVQCNTAYSGVILDTMLCAGETNKDSCQGDSGGPQFVKTEVPRPGLSGDLQIGIVSGGIGCGATGFPGVYTRLSNVGVNDFIDTFTE